MKTKKLIASIAGLATLILMDALVAGSAYAQRPEGAMERPNGFFGQQNRPIGARIVSAFVRFDVDEDGILTEADVPGGMWTRLSVADSDADGSVTVMEAADFLASRMTEKSSLGEGMHGDLCGWISAADSNEDGEITSDELAYFIEDRIMEIQANKFIGHKGQM